MLERIWFEAGNSMKIDISDRLIDTSLFTDILSLRVFLRIAPVGVAEIYLFHSAMFGVATEFQKEIMSACRGPNVSTSDGLDYLTFLMSVYFDTYEQLDLEYPDPPTEELHLSLIKNALDWGSRFKETGRLDSITVKSRNFPALASLLEQYIE